MCREIVEIGLVMWLLHLYCEAGYPPRVVFPLVVLLALNLVVTPWLMMFAREETVVLFDLLMDCCYGSMFPLVTATIPLVNFFLDFRMDAVVEGVLIGRQMSARSVLDIITKIFPLISNLFLLQEVTAVLESRKRVSKSPLEQNLDEIGSRFQNLVISTDHDGPVCSNSNAATSQLRSNQLALDNSLGSNLSANQNDLRPSPSDHLANEFGTSNSRLTFFPKTTLKYMAASPFTATGREPSGLDHPLGSNSSSNPNYLRPLPNDRLKKPDSESPNLKSLKKSAALRTPLELMTSSPNIATGREPAITQSATKGPEHEEDCRESANHCSSTVHGIDAQNQGENTQKGSPNTSKIGHQLDQHQPKLSSSARISKSLQIPFAVFSTGIAVVMVVLTVLRMNIDGCKSLGLPCDVVAHPLLDWSADKCFCVQVRL